MVLERARMNFRLEEIWWLHCCLSNATQIVNSVYAAQLFFWIISMSFNTLSRLYTINERDELSTLLLVRESLLISACVGNLFLIVAICHATASQVSSVKLEKGCSIWISIKIMLHRIWYFKANEVGKIAFSPLSSVIGKRNFTQVRSIGKMSLFQFLFSNVFVPVFFFNLKVLTIFVEIEDLSNSNCKITLVLRIIRLPLDYRCSSTVNYSEIIGPKDYFY